MTSTARATASTHAVRTKYPCSRSPSTLCAQISGQHHRLGAVVGSQPYQCPGQRDDQMVSAVEPDLVTRPQHPGRRQRHRRSSAMRTREPSCSGTDRSTTTRSDAAAPSGLRSGAPGAPAPTAPAMPRPAAPDAQRRLGDVADLKPSGRRRGHADRGPREYCRHRLTVLLANPPNHRNDAQLSPEQPQHRPQE